MAVTPEFVSDVSEALDELGYAVESEQDVIDDVSEINDDLTLPGIRVQSGTMTGYVSMKLAVLVTYLQGRFEAIQSAWNTWFGTDATSGVQKQWADLSGDAVAKTTAANDAANLANQKAALADEKATLANTKAGYANDQGDYAKAQGDYAKNMADHPAYIGTDNFWYLWDYASQKYVKYSYAKGDNLDFTTMTQAEYEQLVLDVKAACTVDMPYHVFVDQTLAFIDKANHVNETLVISEKGEFIGETLILG